MSAQHIGVALRGKRHGGGWLVRCPCPNHGKGRGDRFGDDGRLLLRCFAGCEFIDILDALKRRGLVDETRSYAPQEQVIRETLHQPNAEALAIWRSATMVHDTIAAEYLDRRGIYLRPASLRCHRDRPALIAGVQAPDGRVIAIQQTRLTDTGAKAGPQARMTLGALGAGAVRLGPVSDVLGIAEGVETALSAMQLTGMIVWASLGAQRLHAVELPSTVKVVHVFSDNDSAGQEAARRARGVHAKLGREVYLRAPPDECNDYNDFLNLIADRDGRDLDEGSAA